MKKDDGTIQVNLRISPREAEFIRLIGDGSPSLGARRMIEAVRQNGIDVAAYLSVEFARDRTRLRLKAAGF